MSQNVVAASQETASLNLNALNEEKHRNTFEDWLKDHTNKEDSTSKILDRKQVETRIKCLANRGSDDEFTSQFKHRLKSQKFNIQIVDDKEVLYRLHKNKNFPVAIKEDFFKILSGLHCENRGHMGQNQLEAQVKDRYHNLPRSAIEAFVQSCVICSLKKIQHIQPRIKPIRSEDFLSRLQIDLVDMRCQPCIKNGLKYEWIAHVMDHFSKFHVIWAQQHKTAEEVVENLESRVFAYFGLPFILQSDNGREFKNQLMVNLVESWEGSCKIVHGRPRHPQSQGLVEQANGTLENMLRSMMVQFNRKDWVSFLPKIMFNLNTNKHTGTN
jgi:hypothetical protein